MATSPFSDLVRGALRNPNGKALLAELERMYCQGSTIVPGDYLTTGANEGKRALVQELIDIVREKHG